MESAGETVNQCRFESPSRSNVNSRELITFSEESYCTQDRVAAP
jgi:hypothetical protein